MVSRLDAFAWTDLVLPLSRHHLTVETRELDSSVLQSVTEVGWKLDYFVVLSRRKMHIREKEKKLMTSLTKQADMWASAMSRPNAFSTPALQ